MARSPDPTNEEFYDELSLADQRVMVSLLEIIARLRANLPEKIDYINGLLGTRIEKPAGYKLAPARLTDAYLNNVAVGLAYAANAWAPAVFQNQAQLVIYIIDSKVTQDIQVQEAFDRAGIVRGIMYHFLQGCVDDSNRQVWRLLEPGNVTFLPDGYGDGFSGVACHYKMTMSPNINNWTPTTTP